MMPYINNMQSEIICGYEVTAEMKRVWEAELDILGRIRGICDKHDLKWYAGEYVAWRGSPWWIHTLG